MNRYGYVRVSSTDQNADRQLLGLSACIIARIKGLTIGENNAIINTYCKRL